MTGGASLIGKRRTLSKKSSKMRKETNKKASRMQKGGMVK